MNLFHAVELAEKIKAVLAPFCERIEIAGSIRRARPEVNDIDFVVLPKPAREEQLRTILRKCVPVEKDGPQTMIVHTRDGMQVDIWFAHNGTADLIDREPGNWGSLLLCRTGSKEHNIFLATRARAMDLKWETSRGLVANPDTLQAKVIASETEEEIFKCLGLEFIPPALREVQGSKFNVQGSTVPDNAPDWAAAFTPE